MLASEVYLHTGETHASAVAIADRGVAQLEERYFSWGSAGLAAGDHYATGRAEIPSDAIFAQVPHLALAGPVVMMSMISLRLVPRKLEALPQRMAEEPYDARVSEVVPNHLDLGTQRPPDNSVYAPVVVVKPQANLAQMRPGAEAATRIPDTPPLSEKRERSWSCRDWCFCATRLCPNRDHWHGHIGFKMRAMNALRSCQRDLAPSSNARLCSSHLAQLKLWRHPLINTTHTSGPTILLRSASLAILLLQLWIEHRR